jgi:hypothetical protein
MAIVDEHLLIERQNVTELAGAVASAMHGVFNCEQAGVMALFRTNSALIGFCISGPQGLLQCSAK